MLKSKSAFRTDMKPDTLPVFYSPGRGKRGIEDGLKNLFRDDSAPQQMLLQDCILQLHLCRIRGMLQITPAASLIVKTPGLYPVG